MSTADLISPLLHSPEEAARLMSCGRTHVYALVAAGDIESVKIGRLRRIPHDAILAYINRLRAQQRTAKAAA